MNEEEQERIGANRSFICRCGLCRRESLALSEIKLNCGYGSSYDLQCVRLNLCGDCADALYILLNGRAQNNKEGEI